MIFNLNKLIHLIKPYKLLRSWRMSISSIDINNEKSKCLVAVAQITSTADIQSNYDQIKKLVNRAKLRGAEIVFLPENSDYIGENIEQTLTLAEPLDGETVKRFKSLAIHNNIWLVMGSIHEKINNNSNLDDKKLIAFKKEKLYNTQLVIDNKGEIKALYRKIHLFDMDLPGELNFKESDTVLSGPEIVKPISTPAGLLGMSICYDLRFGEMGSFLRRQGAEILNYPSAFTVPTGMAHFEILLRSRAIENQCYVVAACQVGKHNSKRTSFGHSMIIDSWGTVLAQCSNQVDLCIAEIDLNSLQKNRINLPVQSHQRPHLYPNYINDGGFLNCDRGEDLKFGNNLIKGCFIFCSTQSSYAFVNRKPVLKGHILVSSKRQTARFYDLSDSEVSDLFNLVKKVSYVVEKAFQSGSLTVSIQDGLLAGQSVEHVHVHILPRQEGDFKQNDDIYNQLEKHDKTEDRFRSEKDMEEEATMLRNYMIEQYKS